jgi:catechol 2,3-dioxygenase-like lactoylglutathione lyase family enzyme
VGPPLASRYRLSAPDADPANAEENVSDLGLTHVALPSSNIAASVAFYARYARMEVVHRRLDPVTGNEVAWISDGTRPFVVVLISAAKVEHPLLPIAHLGVGCESRAEVDRLCDAARAEGALKLGPIDSPYPVGYWALLADPDGHTLEVSHGQEVGLTVERHRADGNGSQRTGGSKRQDGPPRNG